MRVDQMDDNWLQNETFNRKFQIMTIQRQMEDCNISTIITKVNTDICPKPLI